MWKVHVLLAMGLINIALGFVIKPEIDDVGQITIENLIVEIKGFEGVNITKTVLDIETKRYIAKNTIIGLLNDVIMRRMNAADISSTDDDKKEITGYVFNLLEQISDKLFSYFANDQIHKYVFDSTIKDLIVDEIYVGENDKIIASKVQSYVANKTIKDLMDDAVANYLKDNDDDDEDDDNETTTLEPNAVNEIEENDDDK